MPVANPSTRAAWFAAAVFVGTVTWVVPCAIGDVREAWDWSVGGFVLLNAIAGFALGAVSARVLVTGLGIAAAHVVCGFISSASAAVIFPGSLVIAVLSFAPAAIGAAIGRRSARTSGDVD